MDNKNEKLKVFIDAVNDEIDGEVSRILADAEERRKAVLAEAESFSADETGKMNGSAYLKNGSVYLRDEIGRASCRERVYTSV